MLVHISDRFLTLRFAYTGGFNYLKGNSRALSFSLGSFPSETYTSCAT